MLINPSARHILTTLKSRGHQAVLAGGSVRDYLLGKEPSDWDIATSALPDEIENIFPRTIAVGKQFGVITVLCNDESFEVATFRTDGSYADGRRPDTIQFSSIEEDASRRDLTINGMFYDMDSGILDFVGGKNDLYSQTIRFIGDPNERIQEDHLRILRAVRFALRLGFNIEDQTYAAIKQNAHLLAKISKERIRDELEKILHLPQYRKSLSMLSDTGILKVILPEIEAYRLCDQNPKWHPEGNVWEHTIIALENLPIISSKEAVWGCLFHDIGKPACTIADEKGSPIAPMHEKKGADIAEQVLTELKFPNSFIESVVFIVGNHMKIKQADTMRLSRLKTLLFHPNADDLLSVSLADTKSGRDVPENYNWYSYIQAHLEEWKKQGLQPKPILRGADLIELGLKPSPMFSIILNAVYDEQLNNAITTHDEAISLAKKKIEDLNLFP